MVYEANRQLNAGVSAPDVADRMEQLRHQVHTFMVPKDLFYLYKRAREKGAGQEVGGQEDGCEETLAPRAGDLIRLLHPR